MWTLQAPLFLLSLLAIAVPLWLHFQKPIYPTVIRFSAFDFLEPIVAPWLRRKRLSDLLLLALKIAILVALALLFAAPQFSNRAQHAATRHRHSRALVIVDASLSMRAHLGERSLFERACIKAQALLQDDEITQAQVVIAGEKLWPLNPTMSDDKRALIQKLQRLQMEDVATHEIAPLSQAFMSSLNALDAPADVYVISDLAAHAFKNIQLTEAQQRLMTHIDWIDAADRSDLQKSLPNHAVQEAKVTYTPQGEPQLHAEFHSWSEQTTSVQMAVWLDGHMLNQTWQLELLPGATLVQELQLGSVTPGVHFGKVALLTPPADSSRDVLAQDNEAFFAFEHHPVPRILLVNGAPQRPIQQDELFYLTRALSTAQPPFKIDTVTTDEWGDLSPSAYQVLVLANVRCDGALRKHLEAALSASPAKALLWSLGSNTSPEECNRYVREFLPAPLKDKWTRDRNMGAAALHMRVESPHHAIFESLEPASLALLNDTNTESHFFVREAAQSVLLRFDSGAPALIAHPERPIMAWLSTIDRDESDACLSPLFAPLMTRIMLYLAGNPLLRQQPALTMGHIFLPRPHGLRPGQTLFLKSLTQETAPVALALTQSEPLTLPPLTPGAYALFDHAADAQPHPGTSFSVRPTLQESDFKAVSAALLQSLSSDRAQSTLTTAKRVNGTQDYSYCCSLVLALLMIAEGIGRALRHQKINSHTK